MDSRGYLTVNASQVLGHKELSFGLGALDWGYKLLDLRRDGGNTYAIDNIITATLIARVRPQGRARSSSSSASSVPLVIMNGDRGPD